ncbi:type II secretion system protein N [Halopseudomonas pachastrellae]|nr:type II secretion system protein N [Halopseudomonas pachastrellae]
MHAHGCPPFTGICCHYCHRLAGFAGRLGAGPPGLGRDSAAKRLACCQLPCPGNRRRQQHPSYPGFRELALLSPLGRADQQRLEINAPDTKLSWTLKGVLSDPDPARSAAILVTQGQPEKLYRVGASLPGQVRLEQVLPDRVMLMRDGQLETLRLKRNQSAGAGRSSSFAAGQSAQH